MLGTPEGDDDPLAGLGALAPGSTAKVAGIGAAPPERPRSEWPFVALMAAVAISGAVIPISAEWGDGGPQSAAAGRGLVSGATGEPAAAGASLFRTSGLRRALGHVADAVGKRAAVVLLRVDAGGLFAVLVPPDDAPVVVRADADRVLSTAPAGQLPGGDLKLSDVDAAAPERMADALRDRFAIAADRIDYVSLMSAGGRRRWILYTAATSDSPAQGFTASSHGRRLARQ